MFFQEIRHAVRMFARSPGFTAVAALSLGLGIALNSALFSFHDAIMWRPLLVSDPDSVVTVTADSPDGPPLCCLSYPNYRDLRGSAQSFDGLVAHQLTTVGFARSREASREMRAGRVVLIDGIDFTVVGVALVALRQE